MTERHALLCFIAGHATSFFGFLDLFMNLDFTGVVFVVAAAFMMRWSSRQFVKARARRKS